ncbi:prokineticin receptor 2-like [Montipora capricornis]|uniref:prokineticin receptor 2-like n=1 Tax=Montipora capricornis TaxID=246305 RepID=UPI0035F1811D
MNGSSQRDYRDDSACPFDVSAFFITTLSVISLASIVGNIFVITAVYRTTVLRTSTNYYYVNMAVSDIIFCVMTWPFFLTGRIFISKGSANEGSMATYACKTSSYLRMVSYSVSLSSLVLIAVDRFVATVYPFKVYLLSRKLRVALISTTWLLSLSFCFPIFHFSSVYNDREKLIYCKYLWNEKVGIFIFVGTSFALFAPICTIIILYQRIMRVLQRKPIQESSAQGSNPVQWRNKTRKKTMYLFILIVAVFFVCWIWPYVILVLEIFSPELFLKDHCHWIDGFAFTVFPALSAVMNPIILFSLSSRFRDALPACTLLPISCKPRCRARNSSPYQSRDGPMQVVAMKTLQSLM